MGMRKPVHVLQLGSSIREIINMVAIAVVEAQATKTNVQENTIVRTTANYMEPTASF
jgi:hypothetical protein